MNPFEEGISRYLPPEIRDKLTRITVGIAGAGGLGSNCAHNLVRLGFCDFIIADFDIVESSNLNRQFFFLDQIGKPKVDALRENLLRINPSLSIRTLHERISEHNVGTAFHGCDVIVEAFDRAESKRLLTEHYIAAGSFVVSASGLAGWDDADALVTHRLGKNFCVVGDLVSAVNDQRPPLAPRVAIAAAKQANAVLRWTIEEAEL
jgi:sulfur carrier protein ThiS adenylyltransferase